MPYAADTEVLDTPVAAYAFAAGLFEGEGTVTISPSRCTTKAGKRYDLYTRPIVTLTNTNREEAVSQFLAFIVDPVSNSTVGQVLVPRLLTGGKLLLTAGKEK